ncbi:ATP-grasp fold amidoligase family protein [Aristaeella lactis]|uniref:TupA-like ATPgrasp n=1 Tax=Aristaeella lactis TaxID=3046383 RepID=A0AC61PJD9_9FIRM|nr:ATP-grasp fold amidoligase family protein [Aristaeella lactis]QUA54040.1 glycosyl transferase [Aristaeella lactis]SMC42673.1 TupA-like ATPgrasp [Aristaeella lactis]
MNKYFHGAIKIMKRPRLIFYYMSVMGFGILNFLSDKACLKLLWWSATGKKLNLKTPKGFNEKIQWLKLYYHKPEYTELADKIRVRDFVKKTIGEKYLIPLIATYDNPDQIDYNSLPNKFVIKCNHNSGCGMCLCRDKSAINFASVNNELKKALQENYYYRCREWQYKNIVPRLICEKYLIDDDPQNTTGTLINYKFYCFYGEPKFLYVSVEDVSSGAKGVVKLSLLDLDWETPPFFRSDHEPLPFDLEKPAHFDEMIEISKKLSKGIPFVRVDLYWVNDQILFSEMTFTPTGGFSFFSPEEWEVKLGEWLPLPDKIVER